MFILPELPYDYSSLEPFIDKETMHLHHDKHHATYIKNLNDSLEGKQELLSMNIVDLLKNLDKVPDEIRTKVRNNGGGHANHTFFWEIMTDNKEEPSKEIKKALDDNFNGFDNFKTAFKEKALSVFGSGWVWLVKDLDHKLSLETTPLQDNPVMTGGNIPVLGLDVWEHAYYLKYKNMRADYIDAWWNVVNWKKVEENFKVSGGDV